MKFINDSNGKVTGKVITVILSLLILNTIANAQLFKIENREYRFEDSKWYNYSSGIKGDVIVPDRLIVRLASREKPSKSDLTNLGISGVNVVSRRLLADYYVLEIDPNVDPFNVAQTLFQSTVFEYVEFDALGSYTESPQDPYFPQQWNLDDTKLRMDLAWNYSTGDNSVILAIIDSGTEYSHEDLDGNIWVNPAEDINGNGRADFYPYYYGGDLDFQDNDNNGKVDDLVGWDFYSNDNSPIGTYYHGTAVAGYIWGTDQ